MCPQRLMVKCILAITNFTNFQIVALKPSYETNYKSLISNWAEINVLAEILREKQSSFPFNQQNRLQLWSLPLRTSTWCHQKMRHFFYRQGSKKWDIVTVNEKKMRHFFVRTGVRKWDIFFVRVRIRKWDTFLCGGGVRK